jgi:pimeloyl-ACP methyl ester carboxylesterase
VVDHILARRGLRKINLLGWSWGTVLMAGYTAQNADKVERLALYAPIWIRTTPSAVAVDGPLPAYRTVTKDAAEKRVRAGVAAGKDKELMPAEWFDAWWNASQATDPVGAAQTPPVIRAPNGVVDDGRKYWSAGVAYYDAARITVPTLLAVAEWDADTPTYMAQALFGKLTNAPRKRLVMIGEGTHSVMMEKNRMQLFTEVQLFLDERR